MTIKLRRTVQSVFDEPVDAAYIATHPGDDRILALSGDNRICVCRYGKLKSDGSAPKASFARSLLDEPLRCLSFNFDGSKLFCASSTNLYLADAALGGADEFDLNARISSICPASAYKAFDCIVTDDDGKIHLLDMRCSQPSVVHSEARVQVQENAGIVAVALGGGDDIFTAFENGVLSAFDLRRREFNDVVMLEECFTSVCTSEKNPILATDSGDIAWIDSAAARVVSKTKYESECVEKLVAVGDTHVIGQLFASEKLLLLSNDNYSIHSTLDVDLVHDVAISASGRRAFVFVERSDGTLEVDSISTKTLVDHAIVDSDAEAANEAESGGFFEGLQDE